MIELELIENAASSRVLFCGERIIDVYHYVKPLGKPMKDAIVSVERVATEIFEGGVIAASKHAAAICEHVDVHTGGIIIEKQRFVEQSHVRKLFEVYIPDGEAVGELPDLNDYDCTIVTDYGHGMVNDEFLQRLSATTYLAVNVQTNSGNYGFNLATKYGYADYLCVDESEARLATQNRAAPIEDSLLELGRIADKVCITLGKNGAIGWTKESGICRVPAFTSTVVDTIGAGDAFFAVTALVAPAADMETLLRIGNAAGAIKANIVGHRRAITKHELISELYRVPR